MNWAKLVLLISTAIPKAVMGVEAISAGAATGATKKQLAMASLGLASSVATDVVPEQYQPAVQAATSLASVAIDNFVALMNSVGVFKHSDTTATATPAPAVETPAQVTNATTPAPITDPAPTGSVVPFNNPEWTK